MLQPKILWAGVSEKFRGGEMGRQLVTAEIAAIRAAAWPVPECEPPAAAVEPLPLVDMVEEKLVLTNGLLTKSKSDAKDPVPWNFGKSG